MKSKIKNSKTFASGAIFHQKKWKVIGNYETKPLWWVGLEDSDGEGIAIVVVGQLLNEVNASYLYELMKFSPSSVEITDRDFKYS